jgi:VanZ family protein
MVILKLPYLFLTLFYCATIFLLSSTANPVHFEPRFQGEDKLVHAVLYGGLAYTVSMGLRRRDRPITPIAQFILPIVFAALYGVSDEFHQSFVPGRTPDVFDACADATGATLMQIFLCVFLWRLWKREEESVAAPEQNT